MNFRSGRNGLVVFLCALLAACAQTGTGGPALSDADRAFIKDAAQSGWAEIQAGEFARERGTEPVRQFGQRMVQDHGASNKELEAIATKLGVTPPQDADGGHQLIAIMLGVLSGSTFDNKYVPMMVKDHQTAIALFEKQSQSAGNAELRQFAAKTLPTLREHLRMAQALPGAR